MGLCLVPDGLTAQKYYNFLKTVPLGILEGMPLAIRQWLNVTYPVICTWYLWIDHLMPCVI